jgi:hypothetical protein
MSYVEDLVSAYLICLVNPSGISLEEARKKACRARSARDRGIALAEMAWAISRLLESPVSVAS